MHYSLISIISMLICMIMVLVVPFVGALFSKRVKGAERFLWAIFSLLLSWPGYFLYYYLRIRPRA